MGSQEFRGLGLLGVNGVWGLGEVDQVYKDQDCSDLKLRLRVVEGLCDCWLIRFR